MASYTHTQKTLPGPIEDASQAATLRIWEIQDPRSLLRLLPERFREAILKIPDDWKNIDDAELRSLAKEQKRPFTPTDFQLRHSLWLEYTRVQDAMEDKMITSNILRGIVSEDYFYNKYIKDSFKLAFMITPPKSYIVAMDEILERGAERIREMMELPFLEEVLDKKSGKVVKKLNVAAANLVLKAHAYVEMRRKGAVEQKLQINGQTMHLDLKADAKDIQKHIQGRNMEDLDKRLAFLEAREKMIEKGIHPAQAAKTDIEVKAEKVIDLSEDPKTRDGVLESSTTEDTSMPTDGLL